MITLEAKGLLLRPPESSDPRHSRPRFSNSQPHLRLRRTRGCGFFLYINQPLALSLFVVLIPLQIYRARQEEKVLEAKFGDEYRQYKSRTWF